MRACNEDLAMPIDATRTPQARKRPVTKLAPFAAIVLAATASWPARGGAASYAGDEPATRRITRYRLLHNGRRRLQRGRNPRRPGRQTGAIREHSIAWTEGRGVDPRASREPRPGGRARAPRPPHAGGDNPSW